MYPNYVPPTAPRRGLNPKLIAAIVGGVLVLLFAVFLIIENSRGGSGETMARVVARHTALATMADEAQKNLVNSELRRINTDLNLFLISDGNALEASMQGFGIKSVPKQITTAEADSEATQRLTQANAAGRFDETYRTVISQKIDEHQALLVEARGKISSTTADESLGSTYEHLESIQRQLNAL